MDTTARLQARLHGLKSEFDRSFAQARTPSEGAGEQLLAIRVAGERHALRLREVAMLAADRKLTPVPSEGPALLGVAGLRGSIVAVYDLAALLGHGAASAPRWLALVRGSLVAIAFEQFEGQLCVRPDAIARAPERGLEVARSEGVSRTILHLPSIVAACELPVGTSSREERG